MVESSPSERPRPLNLKLNRQALIYDDQDSKNILGMGAFGKVLRGQYYDQSVAVKCFNQIHLTDLEKRNIENEAAVMSQLHSPFLVSLLGLGLDDPPVLIMELEQQSLYQLLKDISQDLPWLWRLRILRDIVLALVILHQHEVLHRDLKSLNILLDRDGRTKVGDFGFSTLKQVQDAKQFGTLLWTAPEVLEGKSASTATDMYSFGIICFEVVTRRLPYAGTLLSETLEKVKQGYRESIPTECPAALAKLIETCWAQDPQQRPSAVQAAALLEEMWQEAEKKEDKEIKTESKTVPHRPCCWQDTLSPSYTAALKLIQRRQQVLRQAATNLRGYVALDGQAHPGQTAEPLLPWIQQFLKDPPQALLLQGAAGAGKSTFLLYLEDCLWRDPAWQVFRIGDPWPRAPIPIGLPLGSTQVKARGIWKYLQIWGLTEAEIQWVQDHTQVVFLADGYDEIPQQETPNVFDANHLATWKNRVKLIMACRSQHVQSLSETACFVPHREDGMVDWNNYRSRYIAPFSAAQSKEYIAQFVAADPHRHPEWTEARYQEALQTLPASLIDTPFMLWMILSVLPNQPEVKTELDEKEEKEEKKEASSATTPVTRSRIYHWFLDTWFKRQAIKAWQARMYLQNPDQVLGKVLTQQLKVQAGNHGVEVQVEWLQQGYQLFCLILAQRLAELGQFQVSHDQISLETKGVWMKTLFGSSSDDYARLRQGCPVRRSHHAWSFIHASMLDYFISLSIAQGLLISLNEASPIQVELFARTHNQRSVLNQALALLMRGLLSAEQALFLADQVRKQPVLEKALFQIVECTKTDKSLVTAAANAATVLNYSGASLTHLAWLGVDISGADLSNCILANGDFRGANFRKVRLMNSVLSGSDFRYACLEEVEWGELPRMELKHEVTALAHHPKEKWLAIGQEDRVEIRHRETAELVCAPFTGLTKIESVVFSPSGEFLGIIGKRKVDKYETDRINVWKIEGRQLFLDEGESVSNLVMVFSSDTKMLATYCGWGMGINATKISIWNLENKKTIHEIVIKHYPVAMAFSYDSHFLAVRLKDEISLWDLKAQTFEYWIRKPLYTLPCKSSESNTMAFSPITHSIAFSCFDTAFFWNVGTQREKSVKYPEKINSVLFTPNGQFLALVTTKRVFILNVVNLESLVDFPINVSNIVFTPDSRLLITWNKNKIIRFWNISKLTRAVMPTTPLSCIVDLKFNSDSNLLVAIGCSEFSENLILKVWNGYRIVRLWDVIGQKDIGNFLMRTHPLGSCFTQKGFFYLEEKDKNIYPFSFSSSIIKKQGYLSIKCEPEWYMTYSAISHNGCNAALLRMHGAEILIWNIQSGKLLANLSNSDLPKVGDPQKTNKNFLFNSMDRTALLFSTDSQKLICAGDLHYSGIGRYSIYGDSMGFIEIWDLNSLKLLQYALIEEMRNHIFLLELSSDNRIILFSDCRSQLSLWRLDQPIRERLNREIKTDIFFSKFSPDNQTIFLGGFSQLIQIWDVASFTCVQTVSFNTEVLSIALTAQQVCPGQKPDEDLLVVGDRNGVISFWGVSRTTRAKRFLTMPGPQPNAHVTLDASETKLKGCRMSQKGQKLLQQAGADVSEVKIIEKKSQRRKIIPSFSETMPITLLGASVNSQPTTKILNDTELVFLT